MILVAVAIGIAIGTLAFRKPKQKVTLSRAEAPVRPHMAAPATPAAPVTHERQVPSSDDSDGGGEGEDVGDQMAAAASDVVGQVIGAPVHDQLAGDHQAAADNLQMLKGVGPKLASLLHSRGLFRFEQIAALSPDEVAALDADLGAFKGRLTRDRVIEQAGFLARDDRGGYEAAFGRLGG